MSFGNRLKFWIKFELLFDHSHKWKGCFVSEPRAFIRKLRTFQKQFAVCRCVLRAISHDKFNHVLLHLSVGSFYIASGNYRNILEIRAQQQFEHFVAMKNWAEFNPILFAFEIHVNFIEIWRTNIELLNAVAEKCQICVIAYEQCTHWR